eukprot:356045-Chlamydomonas_euryale.AAC.4
MLWVSVGCERLGWGATRRAQYVQGHPRETAAKLLHHLRNRRVPAHGHVGHAPTWPGMEQQGRAWSNKVGCRAAWPGMEQQRRACSSNAGISEEQLKKMLQDSLQPLRSDIASLQANFTSLRDDFTVLTFKVDKVKADMDKQFGELRRQVGGVTERLLRQVVFGSIMSQTAP